MTLSLEQLAARAASPATSQADLYQLVSNYPQLRPVVAANPNAYPQLLEWLANLNDPQINAGLARSPLPLARQLLAKHRATGGSMVVNQGPGGHLRGGCVLGAGSASDASCRLILGLKLGQELGVILS